MNENHIPGSLIFIAVCVVLFLVAKAAGYRGDAYEFRMTALKVFLAIAVVVALLLILFGRQ